MPAWDVDPVGVRGVLAATESGAAEYDPVLRSLNGALDGAMTQSASDLVAAAVVDLANAQTNQIEFVFTRTGAAIGAAAAATDAYVAGDEEMAAYTAAAAAGAPDPLAVMPGRGLREY